MYVLIATSEDLATLAMCEKINDTLSAMLVFRTQGDAQKYVEEKKLQTANTKYQAAEFTFEQLDKLKSSPVAKIFKVDFLLKVIP